MNCKSSSTIIFLLKFDVEVFIITLLLKVRYAFNFSAYPVMEIKNFVTHEQHGSHLVGASIVLGLSLIKFWKVTNFKAWLSYSKAK